MISGENGCSATAATDVTDATGDLQLTTQGGEVPCSGDGVTISASADGEVEYTWTGPLGFTGSGAGSSSRGGRASGAVSLGPPGRSDSSIGPGAPGCTETSSTPCWSDVEISKIGRYIRLKINNTFIMSYTNATAATNGNIMLGYDDAFDSIGLASSYVIVDNVRVVRIEGLKITSVQDLGANLQLDFTFGLNDTASAFSVLGAAAVGGGYAPTAASIAQLQPGTYRATVPKSGGIQFYRLVHQ